MHIFPESGFDQSVTTPVLLGVLVSWFFTETFGWVFAGLVVPGYLAALFLVHPRSAAIDLLEAVLTYAIARLLGEQLGRTGLTSRVFGRERFLLVLVVSVLVRVAVEGAALARWLGYARWAFSTGLVVVPLTANACWKTGLRRGIVQNGVPTLVVYLLLRYVLIPHTNLSLAGFHLATENVAAAFLASPRTYILLLTGAVVAAVANLRYGWDYNGILIPALLALLVLNPVKLAATFAEVMVLLGAVALLLRTTPLGRVNIEGPRRVTLFFALDYGLRFAFASFVGGRLPGADVVELMGFGYLLPTLLAVKVTQRSVAALVLLPTLTVSCVAFGLSSLIGFGAMALDATDDFEPESITRPAVDAPQDPVAAALWLSALARPSAVRGHRGAAASDLRLPRYVQAVLDDPAARLPPQLQVQRLDQGVVLVRERFQGLDERTGDPAVLAVAAPPSTAGVVLLVPTPLAAPEAAALAGRLLSQRVAGAVVLSGIEQHADRFAVTSAAQVVARGLADRFEPQAARRGLVIVLRRGAASEAGVRLTTRAARDDRAASFLRALRARAGELRVRQGVALRGEDITVTLPLERSAAWLDSVGGPQHAAYPIEETAMFDAARAVNGHVSPEDSLALQRLLLEPLLRRDGAKQREPLSLLRVSAAALGYELAGPSRLSDGAEALALFAAKKPKPLTLIARSGAARGLVLAVPHAKSSALRQLAVRLGSALDADAVLFGFEAGGGALRNRALREALAVATHARAGANARVVLLREAAGLARSAKPVQLATWGGGEAEQLATSLELALEPMGIASVRGALDLRSREDAGRGLMGTAALVTLSIEPRALRPFTAAARLTQRFAALDVVNDAYGTVALRLVASLPAAAPAAPEELLEVAQRALVERSIVARRALEQALATTASRAAIARSIDGTYLVVTGRTRHALLLAAFAAGPLQPRAGLELATVDTLQACAAVLSSGRACQIAGRP